MLIPLPTLVCGALVVLVTGFSSGMYTHHKLDQAKAHAAQQKAIEKERAAAAGVNTEALGYAASEAKTNSRERVVIKEVIRVVQKPVYLEQCLDDDGLHILADDAAASNTRRGFESAVSASGATR